jgi:hypothetical protein
LNFLTASTADLLSQGVSLITQVLYILVFVTRYLDLLHTPIFSEWLLWWNFCAKIFYLASSAYIVFLMTFVYARTREKEKAWKFGMYCLAGAVVLVLPVSKMFEDGPVVFKYDDSRVKLLWSHPFELREVSEYHS